MSKGSTIVFYGIRIEPTIDELDSISDRTHPLIVSARKTGLKYYWGNFAIIGERDVLFIGDKIGVFGSENENTFQVSKDELIARMKDAEFKLKAAGITEDPRLLIEWEPPD